MTEYNVRDYGAAGDGVSNDTAAIARAQVAGGPGATTYFPAGTYIVSCGTPYTYGIAVGWSGVTFRGEVGAMIKAAPGSPEGIRLVFVNANCSDVTFDGLTFDGSSIPAGTGIYAQDVTRLSVRNCTFKAALSGGINLNVGCLDVLVNGNGFVGPGYGILGNDPATGGRWTITGNVFNGVGGSGDGICLNCPTSGLADVVISDNLVHDYTSPGPNSGFGISLEGISRATVKGNVVRNCNHGCIHVESSAVAASTGVVVSGNNVSGSDWGAITIQGEMSGICTDVSIMGNTVSAYCLAPSTSSVGNHLGRGGIECGAGEANGGFGSGVQGLTVVGNVLVSAGSGPTGIYNAAASTGSRIWANAVVDANRTGWGVNDSAVFVYPAEWITNGNRAVYLTDGLPNEAGYAYLGARLAFAIRPPSTGLDY